MASAEHTHTHANTQYKPKIEHWPDLNWPIFWNVFLVNIKFWVEPLDIISFQCTVISFHRKTLCNRLFFCVCQWSWMPFQLSLTIASYICTYFFKVVSLNGKTFIRLDCIFKAFFSPMFCMPRNVIVCRKIEKKRWGWNKKKETWIKYNIYTEQRNQFDAKSEGK